MPVNEYRQSSGLERLYLRCGISVQTRSSVASQVVALVLSDVIGDPLDLIASGPTVRDHSTPKQCLGMFKTLGVTDKLPKRY